MKRIIFQQKTTHQLENETTIDLKLVKWSNENDPWDEQLVLEWSISEHESDFQRYIDSNKELLPDDWQDWQAIRHAIATYDLLADQYIHKLELDLSHHR